jgi:hypothetical protein
MSAIFVSCIFFIAGISLYSQGCHPRLGCLLPGRDAIVTSNDCTLTEDGSRTVVYNCNVHARFPTQQECHVFDETQCSYSELTYMPTVRYCTHRNARKYPQNETIRVHPTMIPGRCLSSGLAYQNAYNGFVLFLMMGLLLVFGVVECSTTTPTVPPPSPPLDIEEDVIQGG